MAYGSPSGGRGFIAAVATSEQDPELGSMGPRGGGPVPFLERSQHSAALRSTPGLARWVVACPATHGAFPSTPLVSACLLLPALSLFLQHSSLNFFKLKLSTLTPKIIWHFYWDHTESIDVLRELGVCLTHSPSTP